MWFLLWGYVVLWDCVVIVVGLCCGFCFGVVLCCEIVLWLCVEVGVRIIGCCCGVLFFLVLFWWFSPLHTATQNKTTNKNHP